MREEKIFCTYGCFIVSRYIKESRKSHLQTHLIFRHTCIYKQPTLTKQCNYNIFEQILYSYFGYTGRVFLGCSLFVVILSEFYQKPRGKDLVTAKSTQKNLCERHHFFDCTPTFLCHFQLLSWSTPSPFRSDVLVEWPL